jgi:type IV pilus assembly protein PilE
MTNSRQRHCKNGFTLIEMMIAVAVAALFAGIALPTYRDHVIRARIGDATGNLLEMRTVAERFYQDRRTYASMPCVATHSTAVFGFSCTSDATTYTITATGAGAMSGFTYTINQANIRRTTSVPTGWSGSGSNCWVLRTSGAC